METKKRHYVFRMMFRLPGEETIGTLLVIQETAERAISSGCSALLDKEGKRAIVESVGKLFYSDEEENDFFSYIVPLHIKQSGEKS